MQLRNYLLPAFLLVFSSFSMADMYIYFVNGAFNSSDEEIVAAADKVNNLFRNGGVTSNSTLFHGRIKIKSMYTNVDEIKFQQKMSSKSMQETFFISNGQAEFVKDYYLEDLGENYEWLRSKGVPLSGDIDTILKKKAAEVVIKRSSDIAYKLGEHITKGDQVILVAHSQGNLYVEGSLAFLYYRHGIDVIRNNIRVVNLGSVSALSYNSSWLSLSQDKFVSGLKLGELINDGVFSITPSNEDACLYPCKNISSNLGLYDVGADINAHGIKETYTNDNIYSFEKKNTLPSIIIQYVQDAIDILEAPIVTSVIPLEVTVGEETIFTVEGRNLTAGMGFAVNDCSPSSVEVAGGTSTKRQFKCTMGQSIGEKNGVIKNRPGGVTAFEFKVQAVLSQVGTWESTLTADGITVKNIFYKNLSALPNGKTVFSGKHSIKYGVSCDLGQDLEITIDRNEKSFGITTVTKSDRTECQEGNVRVYTTGLGVITTRSGELENGVIILNPWNGCDSTINDVCYSYDSIKPK